MCPSAQKLTETNFSVLVLTTGSLEDMGVKMSLWSGVHPHRSTC